MSFVLWNDTTVCPYRLAGRDLTRRYGMGGISLRTLSELTGCARFIGMWR